MQGSASCHRHVWLRWLKECVPSLTERKKWNIKNRHFQVGDLVLVLEIGVTQSTWPLATIIEIIKIGDSTVRVDKMRMRHGAYVQPAVSLCLLKTS